MRIVLAVIVPIVLLSGCSDTPPSSTSQNTGPIRVVATTGMVADIVRNIGGDHVKVTTLMGDGVDPHLYKASPGDVKLLADADMIVYSGLHLEGKMGEVFERLAKSKPVFAVTETLTDSQKLGDGHGFDPHAWFDVKLWLVAAYHVRDKLIAHDPANETTYHANMMRYLETLTTLDREARTALATIPKDQRVLVTAHDAFRYFGRAYDVEVRGIQGISTESEAGVREINELVDFLVTRKIKAVFVESSVSDKNVKALVEGCRARGHTIAIGGELFSDAMGKDGTPEGTYAGMVRCNVETIVKALK